MWGLEAISKGETRRLRRAIRVEFADRDRTDDGCHSSKTHRRQRQGAGIHLTDRPEGGCC